MKQSKETIEKLKNKWFDMLDYIAWHWNEQYEDVGYINEEFVKVGSKSEEIKEILKKLNFVNIEFFTKLEKDIIKMNTIENTNDIKVLKELQNKHISALSELVKFLNIAFENKIFTLQFSIPECALITNNIIMVDQSNYFDFLPGETQWLKDGDVDYYDKKYIAGGFSNTLKYLNDVSNCIQVKINNTEERIKNNKKTKELLWNSFAALSEGN